MTCRPEISHQNLQTLKLQKPSYFSIKVTKYKSITLKHSKVMLSRSSLHTQISSSQRGREQKKGVWDQGLKSI